MRDLDIELENQDDEIIDLEDIIEMPANPIDEDEDLDLDAEILDVDSYFEPEPEPEPERPIKKTAQPFMEELDQRPGSKHDDLVESFGDESEEDDGLFEPVESRGPAKKTVHRAEPDVFEEDNESVLDEFMDMPDLPDSRLSAEKRAGLRQRTVAAIKVAEESRVPAGIESELISDESFESTPQPDAPQSAPVPPPADISQIVEELIGRIESRLQEHIRVMVESMLPDLVRSIINEELEKLKKELG